MSLLILFCHWLDFYQMVFPGPMKIRNGLHVPMILV